MAYVGKLQKSVRLDGTKIVCCWTVEACVQEGNELWSEPFRFGPGEWKLVFTSSSGFSNPAEVILKGPFGAVPHFEGRISWKFSVHGIKVKSVEGLWKKGADRYHRLPLWDFSKFVSQRGILKVLCELHIIAEISSQTEMHPEMAYVGKLQKTFQLGGPKIVCLWTVEDYVEDFQEGKEFWSQPFRFGPGEWKLYFWSRRSKSSSPGFSNPAGVELMGPIGADPHFEGRISWKFSILGIEDRSSEGVWGKGAGLSHNLPLWDVRRSLPPDSFLEVLCELHIVDDVSSQTEKHPGDPEIAGRLQLDVRCTKNSWIIPKFRVLAQRVKIISSRGFEFGSRLWQLHISPHTSDVSVSLESAGGSGAPFPFSWKLSVDNDRGAVLKRTDGVCEGAEESLDVTLHLGPLPDVEGFVESEGALRVQCELRQSDEITDTPSRVETEAGTDILVRDFQRLLTSGESSDPTVRVKGEREFRVHRSVLVARTPVFASMFTQQMSESGAGAAIVNVEDCEPDIFRQFLQHVYTGRGEDLRPENAIGLYQLADRYQVDDLKSKCLECVKGGMSIELFCPALKLALQHSEAELTQLVTEFFANNMLDIMVTVEWNQLMAKNPKQTNELVVRALKATSRKCKNTRHSREKREKKG